jgi:hypothetical protein
MSKEVFVKSITAQFTIEAMFKIEMLKQEYNEPGNMYNLQTFYYFKKQAIGSQISSKVGSIG